MSGELKRKRNRDPLSVNEHQKRCIKESQTTKIYLEKRLAKTFISPSQKRKNYEKGQALGRAAWGTYSSPLKKVFSPVVPAKKSPEFYRSRRVTIYHFFLSCGWIT